MTAGPAVTPDRDAIARGDHVCWADPYAALHEGIVQRVFDRFVEIEHREGRALRRTMVYTSRLAAIAYCTDGRRGVARKLSDT
jgi:hypothetical protein